MLDSHCGDLARFQRRCKIFVKVQQAEEAMKENGEEYISSDYVVLTKSDFT